MTSINFSFRRPQGVRGIFVIWLGQMISGIASSITFFAWPFWILDITDGSGTAIGIWEFLFFASYLLVTQFAGVLIDRHNRKLMMLVHDFLSLAATAILLVIETTARLELWHLYVVAAIQGIGFAFQSPSYSAAITTMVPRKHYVRANGLMGLIFDTPEIFGPILAGTLVTVIGLSGILAVNLIALIISIGALLFVEVPPTPHTVEGEISHKRFFEEVGYGIKYIFKRPGLLGIQLIFLFGNLFSGIALSAAALYPMILSRTGGNTEAVGAVQSAGALAAVLAGITLSTWGGIKRPVRVVLLGWLFSCLFGVVLLGAGRTITIWLIASVIYSLFSPIVDVSIDTFLQTKVAPDLQGRVFSAGDFLAQTMVPFTPLLAGLFGDRIFEPAMTAGGTLAGLFGWLVGTTPGAGFGLLIVFCGISGTLVSLSGYLIPALRNAENTLPDHDDLTKINSEAAASS